MQNPYLTGPQTPGILTDTEAPDVFATPKDIAQFSRQINTLIMSMDADIDRSSLDMPTIEKWNLFLAEWQQYFGPEGLSWWSTLWGSTWDRLRSFERRAKEWHELLSKRVGFTSPPPRTLDETGVRSPMGKALKWGLVLGGLGVGAYTVSRVVRAAKDTKELVTFERSEDDET